MPFIPGLLATPTVLANALLSLTPDPTLPVAAPDRVGVVSPMFNEEMGAAAALGSLLGQSVPFDELVVSINGGTDGTAEVVRATLTEHGYRPVHKGHVPAAPATFERWLLAGGTTVVVVEHAAPLSKSDSVNVALEGGLLNCERVLIVDGDTVLEPTFLARLKTNFYRLRRLGRGPRTRYVLEDYAVQSGSVMSARPGRGKPVASLIHQARTAEYAISTVLRQGQTARLGRGRVFGESRLYTVVGCGFTARRDCFPMPADTMTEDHDFTLLVQSAASEEVPVSARELTEQGFNVVLDGKPVPLAEVVGELPLSLRRGGNARFVSDALMFTDDPLSLPGYLGQIERWNGGGVENALKRLFVGSGWRSLTANVKFTLLAAQFENLFGLLLLLLALPLALGLNYALPGHGTASRGLLLWLAIDLLATGALALLGLTRQGRGAGKDGWGLRRWAAWRTLLAVLPLALLRGFNAVTYVTGALRALGRFSRAQEVDPRSTITWERPRASTPKRTQARFVGATGGLALFVSAIFAFTAWAADESRPGYRDTWRLINESVPVLQDEHRALPVPLGGSSFLGKAIGAAAEPAPLAEAPVAGTGTDALAGATNATDDADAPPVRADAGTDQARPGGETRSPSVTELAGSDLLNSPLAAVGLKVATSGAGRHKVSAFCSVGDVARASDQRREFGSSGAEAYEPLSGWGLLVLARLAPLVAGIEEAASAYDVAPDLLLRVLINESYLDPLAIGPTGDLGLSQVTSDALTLLAAISNDPLSPFANEQFFSGPFSVFDPDFSICAGAAKLAWAGAQPGGQDEQVAYARYINPLEGVVRGKISARHASLVEKIEDLKPLTGALASTIAAYRADPSQVTDKERALLGVTSLVADGTLTVGQAYFVTAELVQSFGIDDLGLYDAVRTRLYGEIASPAAPAEGTGGVG